MRSTQNPVTSGRASSLGYNDLRFSCGGALNLLPSGYEPEYASLAIANLGTSTLCTFIARFCLSRSQLPGRRLRLPTRTLASTMPHMPPAVRLVGRRERCPVVHRESGTRLQQRHRYESRGQSGGRRRDQRSIRTMLGVARRAAAAGSGRIRGALAQALCRRASDAGQVQLHRGVRLSVIRGLETAASGHEDPFPWTRPNRQCRRICAHSTRLSQLADPTLRWRVGFKGRP
jgi:hypothetical protein